MKDRTNVLRGLKRLISRYFSWLDEQWPRMCARCGSIHQIKNMKDAQLTVGKWVLLCRPCFKELYHPFSKDE